MVAHVLLQRRWGYERITSRYPVSLGKPPTLHRGSRALAQRSAIADAERGAKSLEMAPTEHRG